MNNFYDVWFSVIDISNIVKIKLLEKYSSKEVFEFNRNELICLNLKETTVDKILFAHKFNLDKYFNYLEKYNIKVISFRDEFFLHV